MNDYIVVYYYNKKERNWVAEVRDEVNSVIDSVKAYTEYGIKERANDLRKKYDALRITKTTVT